MKTQSKLLVINGAIFFAVFFLWVSVAVIFSQAPKSTGAAQPAASKGLAQPVAKAASTPNAKDTFAPSDLEKVKADQERIKNATEVAHEWFRRLNALDGSKESIDRFVDLFQPNAEQISGPRGDDQIGTSMFEGREKIGKFAEKTGKEYTRIAYFIRQRTVNNKTAEMLVANVGPWGEISLALEFSGSVNIKDNKGDQSKGTDPGKEKRFTVPGAAFFDIKDGKISRIRIMYASGESFPVGGTWVLSL